MALRVELRLSKIINWRRFRKHFFTLCCIFLTVLTTIIRFHIWWVDGLHERTLRNAKFKVINHQVNEIFDLKAHKSTLDSSGEFVLEKSINEHLIKKTFKSSDTTILTYSSIKKLIYLPLLEQTWKGPISFAIFVDNRKIFYDVVRSFAICHVGLLNRVLFHIVYPVKSMPMKNKGQFNKLLQDLHVMRSSPLVFCQRLRIFLKQLCDEVDYAASESYPVGLLQNLAFQEAKTDYVIHLDIDLVPSRNMRQLFNSFISLNHVNQQMFFIPPVFEVDEKTFDSLSLPITKKRLKMLLSNNLSQPFDFQWCPHCQSFTNYSRWLALPKLNELHAAYEVYWRFPYEPFYFSSSKQSPAYNESFFSLRSSRLSQLCQLYLSQSKFFVLDSVFLLHRGLGRNSLENKLEDKSYLDLFHQFHLQHSTTNKTCL